MMAAGTAARRKIAVVLFNLGGPDSPDAVEPFLRNLFSDPAIIRVPGFLRWFIARMIARGRAPEARKIYAELGGASPIVPQTQAQAEALTRALTEEAGGAATFRVFTIMRYWHPRASEVVAAIQNFAPDAIVTLPLYPQFSTTTTASSLAEFESELKKAGVSAPVHGPCCYPDEPGFVAAYADLTRAGLAQARAMGRPRLLFSAHGLPEKIVKAGDPYAWQVERSAAAIAARLGEEGLDWRVTYQSRVGPLKWIGPSTEEEIKAAAAEGLVPVICPLAFVSEHSETLVELDIEYRHLAEAAGAPGYVRVPAVGIHGAFIAGLAGLVLKAAKGPVPDCRTCPAGFKDCPKPAA